MALTPVTNGASHPVDLEGGRVLAPGERDRVDLDLPHNQALVDSGQLVAGETPKPKSRTNKENS